MRPKPKMNWTNMWGCGPSVWDQDNATLKMHTPIHHEHHEQRKEHEEPKVKEADQAKDQSGSEFTKRKG